MNAMGVSVVLVTYNRVNLLKECLNCLLTQSYSIKYIFIINNHSTDGTYNYLKSLNNNKIIVKNTHKNLGGAGGFSIGLKFAFEYSNSKYFWLMDDDTMPTTNSLMELINGAKNIYDKKFGFLCSNVRWWKNYDPCNIPVVDNNWTELASKSLIRIKEATFVSFLVPRYVVYNLGLPIKDMFIWGDDTEYSSRISNEYHCYLATNSIVIHKSHNPDLSNYNVIYENNDVRLSFYKFMYRNRIFVEKRYRPFRFLLKWLVIDFMVLLKIPFKSHNKRLKRAFYVICGIFSGFLFNPKIRYPLRNRKIR